MATDAHGTANRLPALRSEPFGETPDGRAARLLTLENSVLRVAISDFGGRMVRIECPDRHGRRADVLLGFDNVRHLHDRRRSIRRLARPQREPTVISSAAHRYFNLAGAANSHVPGPRGERSRSIFAH